MGTSNMLEVECMDIGVLDVFFFVFFLIKLEKILISFVKHDWFGFGVSEKNLVPRAAPSVRTGLILTCWYWSPMDQSSLVGTGHRFTKECKTSAP